MGESIPSTTLQDILSLTVGRFIALGRCLEHCRREPFIETFKVISPMTGSPGTERFALCPWFSDLDTALIHPEDLSTVRRLMPYGKVFSVGDEDGEFIWLAYGNTKFRARSDVVQPLCIEPRFILGDEVRVKADGTVAMVTGVMWHHKVQKPFFLLSSGRIERKTRYWEEDLDKLSPPS